MNSKTGCNQLIKTTNDYFQCKICIMLYKKNHYQHLIRIDNFLIIRNI